MAIVHRTNEPENRVAQHRPHPMNQGLRPSLNLSWRDRRVPLGVEPIPYQNVRDPRLSEQMPRIIRVVCAGTERFGLEQWSHQWDSSMHPSCDSAPGGSTSPSTPPTPRAGLPARTATTRRTRTHETPIHQQPGGSRVSGARGGSPRQIGSRSPTPRDMPGRCTRPRPSSGAPQAPSENCAG